MSETLTLSLIEPNQARDAVRLQFLPYVGQLLDAGKRVAITACELEDERSLKQLRFYWGPMLKDISEQASIGGQKYSKDAWHELGKRQFLPRKITVSRVAGRRRPVTSVSLGSTKGLPVRKMSKYLTEFQAFAVTDLGVVFTIANWESYQ